MLILQFNFQGLLFSILALIAVSIISIIFAIILTVFGSYTIWFYGHASEVARLFGPTQILIGLVQGIVGITIVVFSCPIVCCGQSRQMKNTFVIQLDPNGQSNLRNVDDCEDDLPSYDQTCGNEQKNVDLDNQTV